MSRDAVIVFAKPPEPGTVKTRLFPVLSPVEAARLYRAFMRDIFARCDGLSAAVRVYAAPPADAFPLELLPEHATFHEQRGCGLGPRMRRAFEDSFAAGHERVVIIGTDYPTIEAAVLRRALDALKRGGPRRAAIGPSTDGGYYLLGLGAPCAAVFDMAYSHADVLAQTMRALTDARRIPVLLPEGRDIDRPEDLERLVGELEAEPMRAAHTHAALKELSVSRRERR